jgi:hypothetical protein
MSGIIYVAGISGVLSLSKTTLFVVALPVIGIAVVQRRYVLAAYAGFLISFFTTLIGSFRVSTYYQVYEMKQMNLNPISVFFVMDYRDLAVQFFAAPALIVSRIDNALNFSLAVNYPVSLAGGDFQIFSRLIFAPLVPGIDPLAHNKYFTGQNTNSNTFSSGGVMSWAVTLISSNFFWIFLLCALLSILLLLIDNLAHRLGHIAGIPSNYCVLLSILGTIILVTTLGSLLMWALALCLFLVLIANEVMRKFSKSVVLIHGNGS